MEVIFGSSSCSVMLPLTPAYCPVAPLTVGVESAGPRNGLICLDGSRRAPLPVRHRTPCFEFDPASVVPGR